MKKFIFAYVHESIKDSSFACAMFDEQSMAGGGKLFNLFCSSQKIRRKIIAAHAPLARIERKTSG